MKLPLLVGGALLIAASATTAHAAPPPGWCKDADTSSRPDLGRLTDADPEVVLETFVRAMCAPTDEVEANRAAIEKNRQAWGKRFGLAEADWADVVDWTNHRGPQPTFSTKDPSQFTAVDQYLAIVEGFEQPGGSGPLRDPSYAADVFGAALTEVGRLGYLTRCLRSDATPVEWALCQGDVDAFDLATFHTQLRADTAHAGAYKMMLRLEASGIKARIKQHAVDVAAIGKQDPAYQRMFEITARARTEWAALATREAALLALVKQVEAAHFSRSRSARAGCEATTAAALAKATGALPARAFAGLFDQRFDPTAGFAAAAGPVLMNDPAVNLAATAYALCQDDGTAKFLRQVLIQTPGNRGPRTLAFTRLLTEKFQLDDVDARITWPTFERPYDTNANAPISAGGVVASTKVDGELVKVTFESLKIKREECVESHQTSKIYRLHADGRVEYEQVCDRMGVVTHDDQWMDFTIARRFLPQLEKGARISVVYPPNGATTGAEVIATWPSAKATAPTWLLGAVLR